jgi:hypothetical protein
VTGIAIKATIPKMLLPLMVVKNPTLFAVNKDTPNRAVGHLYPKPALNVLQARVPHKAPIFTDLWTHDLNREPH